MLTKADKKHWGPSPQVIEYVASLVPQGARVLEVGPGHIPFSKATHFIDQTLMSPHLLAHVPADNIIVHNVETSPLPFPDNYFDFIYCRHVVEDIAHPFGFLHEMSRVGKGGYIETPSVLAEACRGVDGGSPAWRGYHHHHWFVTNHNGRLKFIRKLPMIEHIKTLDENNIANTLRLNPVHWNTYLLWQDSFQWEEIRPLPILQFYPGAIAEAIKQGIDSTNQLLSLILDVKSTA